MNLWQSLLIAVGMLRLHKLRAFLTMLGVIIGVMSVTIIIMVSNGFQYFINNEFQKLGADTIVLVFDPGQQGPVSNLGRVDGLTMDDLEYLERRVHQIGITSPIVQIPPQRLRRGDREITSTQIWATDENFAELNRLNVQEGRHLNAADLRHRSNVCVIGEEVRDSLFPDKQALGKLIAMPGINLEVVGVLERFDLMGSSTGRSVMLPISTAQSKWLGGENLTMITLRPKEGLPVEQTMDAVWEAMMYRSGGRPVYRLDSRESILNVFGSILGVAGAVLAAIAALSLLVGGIGIMNIMLVSVNERTREIGLRKAVGAKNGAILNQFLVEAAMLSLVGGLIGMGVAYAIGTLITIGTTAAKWPTETGLVMPFPLPAAMLAMAFSALIGMVFGLYPALSASRMHPIEALRHE